jgi:AcrR family transcriptional regulator
MKQRTEESILACAAEILERDGPEGLTTRSVCSAAGITAPTLYHHFGDKDGLLDALVSLGIQEFSSGKRNITETDDPLADLKSGWKLFIEFLVGRPQLMRLMAARANEIPQLADEVHRVTRARLEKLHKQKRLRTSVDFAARAIQTASNGVMALLTQGASRAELRAMSSFFFDAIMAQLLEDGGHGGSRNE